MTSKRVKKRWQGLHHYRYRQNPLEKRFALAWQEANEHGNNLEYSMGDGNRRAEVTKRDELVSSTVIQWLGSPVGQHFLLRVLKSASHEELGYELRKLMEYGKL
jgi:hypothetical protein